MDWIYVANDTDHYDVFVNIATNAWNRIEKRPFTSCNMWSQ
jgi:hypothetical protein